MNTVVVCPDLRNLEEFFVQQVGEHKAGDPLRPLTVIVGSNIQHQHLRRRLAREYGAVANIRFLTFLDLAGELLLDGGRATLRPLPDGSESLLVRAAAHGSDAAAQLNLDVTGMADVIGATICDPREGAIAPTRSREMTRPRNARRSPRSIARCRRNALEAPRTRSWRRWTTTGSHDGYCRRAVPWRGRRPYAPVRETVGESPLVLPQNGENADGGIFASPRHGMAAYPALHRVALSHERDGAKESSRAVVDGRSAARRAGRAAGTEELENEVGSSQQADRPNAV